MKKYWVCTNQLFDEKPINQDREYVEVVKREGFVGERCEKIKLEARKAMRLVRDWSIYRDYEKRDIAFDIGWGGAEFFYSSIMHSDGIEEGREWLSMIVDMFDLDSKEYAKKYSNKILPSDYDAAKKLLAALPKKE
jgi:hypothetical protein